MMPADRTLAIVAAAAALLAAFAGSPPPDTRPGAASATVSRGIELSAIDLAAWIRDRRGVHVIDLRSETAFDDMSIPTATRATLTELPRLPFAVTDTVVLYSDAAPHVAHAAALLRARGLRHVNVVPGGLDAWLSSVLDPTLPHTATPEQERAFARVAELSRYFGGTPRRTDGAADGAFQTTDAAERANPDASAGTMDGDARANAAVQRIRRRGC